jgi:hypothetical protein
MMDFVGRNKLGVEAKSKVVLDYKLVHTNKELGK